MVTARLPRFASHPRRALSGAAAGRLRTTLGLLGILALLAGGSCGTGGPAVPPRGVAEAEAEARDHPRRTPAQDLPPPFQRAVGEADRRCVVVEPYPTSDLLHGELSPRAQPGAGLRSGEFVAGPLAAYADAWRRDPRTTKLWWVPLHTSGLHALTLRAVLLDDPSITRTFTSTILARSDDVLFYPSTLLLPASGRWMLIATAGSNWGCFVMTLAA